MKILRDFLGVFAVLVAVGVIASFCFLPVASVNTHDANDKEATVTLSALELAFGSDVSDDLGYAQEDVITTFKSGWYIALAFGAANGAVNLFVMILSNIMPVSLMFPLISAGGIIITYLISKFIYKENLTKNYLE